MRDNLGAFGQVLVTLFGLGLLVLGAWILYTPDEFRRKAELGKDEFARLARPVDARKIEPKNQGKPVIVTGDIKGTTLIKDEVLGTKFPDAVSVYREVTMCQNDENWVGSGDNERMAGYNKIWSEELEPCPSLPNPPMPMRSQLFMGTDYKVGAFTISRDLAGLLEGQTTVLPTLNPTHGLDKLGKWDRNASYITCGRGAPDQLGDLRLRYQVLEPCQVTVLGVQQGDRIEPFIDVSGSPTHTLMKGPYTPTAAKDATGDAGSLPSLGVARFLAFWPLWLGLGVLFHQRWGRADNRGTSAVIAGLGVPAVMYAVHFAVWKVLPKLVF